MSSFPHLAILYEIIKNAPPLGVIIENLGSMVKTAKKKYKIMGRERQKGFFLLSVYPFIPVRSILKERRRRRRREKKANEIVVDDAAHGLLIPTGLLGGLHFIFMPFPFFFAPFFLLSFSFYSFQL